MSGSATWERVGQNSGLLLHWVPDNSGQAPLMISHWLGLADFTIVEHFGQRVCILRICADGGHDQAGIRGPRAKTHQRASLSHGIMRPATMSWLAPAAHNQQKQIDRHRIAQCNERDTLGRPYIFALTPRGDTRICPADSGLFRVRPCLRVSLCKTKRRIWTLRLCIEKFGSRLGCQRRVR
jgi:hypothetical protein